MRTKTYLIVSLTTLAALLAGCAGAAFAHTETPTGQGDEAKVTRTVTVTGSGKVYLTPDSAYITIGVHTEGENAAEAVASNNTQSQREIDALLAQGIAEKDIQTTNFSIYPQQEYDTEGKPTGKIEIYRGQFGFQTN